MCIWIIFVKGNFFLKGKLSFKWKWDKNSNAKDEKTLWYNRHNSRLRPIPSIKLDETKWEQHKLRFGDGKIP